MKKLLTLVSCFILIASATFADVIGVSEMPSTRNTIVVDDFKNGNYWIWDGFDWDQYGAPKIGTSARLSRKWASQGNTSLECKLKRSTQESSQNATYYMDYTWDFTGGKYVAIDVYNPEDFAFNIGIAFQTTNNWNWQDLGNYNVQPGVHTLVFDISHLEPEHIREVKRITVSHVWGTTPRAGIFYIDNLRILK